MFEFTETIGINAAAATVWAAVQDIETWWPPSNPEHDSIERLDDRGAEVGARLRIREKIAGIPGEAIGVITSLTPGSEVTWQSDNARYRWFGVPITVAEGVTWRIEPDSETACSLSAHVWASFPRSLRGAVLAWAFEHMLNGIAKDRQHARAELKYLKKTIEATN